MVEGGEEVMRDRGRHRFRYVDRGGEWGGDRRRKYGGRRWEGRGEYGGDMSRGGERIDVNQHDDEGGWQKVHSRRRRENGGERGAKYADIISRASKSGLEKNVVSFFFSKFPGRYKARDMFEVFSDFGRVLEVVIPTRKDGRGRRFGFVGFQDVVEPERMAIKLDNIFVEGEKIYANLPRFNRDSPKSHGEPKRKCNSSSSEGVGKEA